MDNNRLQIGVRGDRVISTVGSIPGPANTLFFCEESACPPRVTVGFLWLPPIVQRHKRYIKVHFSNECL